MLAACPTCVVVLAAHVVPRSPIIAIAVVKRRTRVRGGGGWRGGDGKDHPKHRPSYARGK